MRSENSQKIGQGILKYKDWIFDSIFLKDESPIEKENLNFEEKSPNLNVYGLNWIFIWIYRRFDCKKNWFLSQFGL